VTEGQFWKELRARVNQLHPGADGPRFPGWCDWFDPKSYSAGPASARIVGRVIFVKGGRAFRWRFTVLIDRPISSFEEFDWEELQDVLPQDDESDWLTVDGERLTIELPPPCRSSD